MRSPVLEASISGGFQVQYEMRDGKQYQKIVIEDIEPSAFKAFLKFLYTDKLEVNAENIMSVLHTGSFKFRLF